MKIKKGKVYPSPSSSSSSSLASSSAIPCPSDGDFFTVLKLLPTAILALASVLSLEDREVLAYMITRSMKPTTPSPITHDSKKKPTKKSPNNCGKNGNHTHKPPMFDCDCFDCYTSFWFRWDSSPNRVLIHQAIEAFEDHLAHGEQSKKVNGRGKRREKPSRRAAIENPVDVLGASVPLEIEESCNISLTSPLNDEESVSSTAKADGVLERNAKDENKELEMAVEEFEVENDEEEAAADLPTMVAASSNHHKGLARKVLPDVLGLFNSRLWNLWSPNA